ncbi:hypothetical protein BIW11_05309 [Tropilaelaps mercedesae]|uniref:Uncharacterized protein n=1 Tax=Tropilaelaps mercedesae TaxID=418985 RepID=A0A1V9Y2W4_9ACAR|nr:hypothetical protein BIW11_05309 [Tropilaelaps mercedesae]
MSLSTAVTCHYDVSPYSYEIFLLAAQEAPRPEAFRSSSLVHLCSLLFRVSGSDESTKAAATYLMRVSSLSIHLRSFIRLLVINAPCSVGLKERDDKGTCCYCCFCYCCCSKADFVTGSACIRFYFLLFWVMFTSNQVEGVLAVYWSWRKGAKHWQLSAWRHGPSPATLRLEICA